jgi:hypothetical protein
MFYAQKRRHNCEILGSNGIFMLDGRWSKRTAIEKIKDSLSSSNIDNADSFQLFKGERFTTARPVSVVIKLETIQEMNDRLDLILYDATHLDLD